MRKLMLICAVAVMTVGCKDKAAEQARIQQERSLDSLKVAVEQQQREAERQRIVDSMNAVTIQREAGARSVASHTTTSTTTTTTTQRKGMSSAAKGALIGAGAGAITGAAVSKKKGEGAIIGGLAGAAVGAGTGAIIDDKKKKQ